MDYIINAIASLTITCWLTQFFCRDAVCKSQLPRMQKIMGTGLAIAVMIKSVLLLI